MLGVMSFLNQQQQNSFTNAAIAQEYDKYGDNYYNIYQIARLFEGFFISSVEFCKVKFDK